MALGTLSIDLVAKFAQFEADLGKAVRASQKTAQQISSAFSLVKTAAVGLGAGIGVGGLISLARASIDSVDALNDVADATGASIENISALEDVAARTGTSLDSVAGSLVKFNDALKNAKPDSSIAAALDAIGLSAVALRNLDPAEALRQTAVALSRFADDGNKARLVQELFGRFGRSVREVAPFLKDLAEQGRLVATVTAAQAAEAEKFNKQLFELQKNAQDLTRVLVGPLVSAINETGAAFRRSAAEGKGFFESGLDRYLENVRNFYVELGVLRAKGAGVDDNQSAAETARLGRFIPPRPSVSYDAAADKVTKGRNRSSGIKSVPKELDLTNQALGRYAELLESAIEKTQDLTATEEALLFLRKQQGVSTDDAARILNLARQIDATRQLTAETEALADIDKALADQRRAELQATEDRLKSLIDATPTAKLEESRKDMLLLADALERGFISQSVYLEAVNESLGLTADKLEKSKTLAEELGLTFTSAFEDAIVNGGKFSEVLKGLEQDILRIVTRKLVTEPLGNAITGIFSGGGAGGGIGGALSGLFGKLFGFDGGGYTGDGPRSGGLDGKGGYLAMMHPRETVIDHARGQRAGNTVSLVINQSFAPGTSRATTLQAAADARRQLEFAGRNL